MNIQDNTMNFYFFWMTPVITSLDQKTERSPIWAS